MTYSEKPHGKCPSGYTELVAALVGKCSVGCSMMMTGNTFLGLRPHLVLEPPSVRALVWYALAVPNSQLASVPWGVWIFGMLLCV